MFQNTVRKNDDEDINNKL